MKTLVKCVKCKKCGDLIYSRARYDYHSCSCGKLAVDGGFDYLRICGDFDEKIVKKFVNVSKKELYNDWNKGIHKFGIIKGKNV